MNSAKVPVAFAFAAPSARNATVGAVIANIAVDVPVDVASRIRVAALSASVPVDVAADVCSEICVFAVNASVAVEMAAAGSNPMTPTPAVIVSVPVDVAALELSGVVV